MRLSTAQPFSVTSSLLAKRSFFARRDADHLLDEIDSRDRSP
jgi:hypothetical protein